ncbi:MAG: aminopeptidase [Burkholderiales bacterium]|nr:aminopeptidase [Burkholderiales bacterium]
MRPWRRAAAAMALLGLGGCSSLGYLAQSVNGHLALIRRAKPVSEWLSDAQTPPALRQRLLLSQRLRSFAVSDLALPDNASYRRYADLGRDAVVWNVVAAPELSLTLKTWCFPLMGCVGYRGYYARADTDALASQLRAEGWEVDVYAVPAYSTLGWTNWLGGDPLLSTFIQWPESDLARLIFHELAHQVAYAADDTMFNESFATAVERLGQARWRAAQGLPADEPALDEQRRREFRALATRTRAALDALYRGDRSDDDKRRAKAEIFAGLRAELARLKTEAWGGYTGYDGFAARANNAVLAVQAAYDELVPQFERLFERQGRDFPRFYAEVKRLAALPKDERRATLSAH